ncbi:hypothetical protein [Aquabacter spiritensis]|uniref:DUF3024 family protein n=1 Tax=Aquabacter spiritensis TaxID=933073 RepID=A0A4R3M3P2_9HYPH|nr:hypothetical protein [Aquabacter spiritensis]TCT07871.1 hypothetical protein EDC64_101390 [Aquabacter spiritensis]
MALSILPGVLPCPHPNDLDRKRIERSLMARKRYRYVAPSVVPMPGGYQIVSPCCSRNIDPAGGTIDVARLLHDAGSGLWQLFRKDHGRGAWDLDSTHARLATMLDRLNADPERAFWQ